MGKDTSQVNGMIVEMVRPLQTLLSMTRWERWVAASLVLAALLSAAGLVRQFYIDNTVVTPTSGGTYIEGSVGQLLPLNPWFIVQNDVNRDIVSLVFSGLLKYNPQTKKIEEDLATMQVSKDYKVYTLRLKENLFWHDTTVEQPHPVTADDVVFTFTTIQNPDFPNILLQQNFRGVKVEKIDARTVRFTLEEAYSFFPSNLTLGILPQKSFEGIPVSQYDQHLEFGYAPVGAGPYRVKNIVQTDLSSEVTLERFERSLEPVYRLDRIVFRIFPDYSTLLSDLRNLQGIRTVPKNNNGKPVVPKRFEARTYYLPQYVALFLNLDKTSLQDQKLRLGLQLGTNKQAIVDAIGESAIVDTPLLELDVSDWHYQFDASAAQGALLASKWNIPERIRLQHVLEQEEANKAGVLALPQIMLVKNSPLIFTGSVKDVQIGSRINSIPVQQNQSRSGSWIIRFPIVNGTGALKMGENLLRVTDIKGKIIDSFYLFITDKEETYKKALEERELVDQYVKSKAHQGPQDDKISATDLYVDQGMLRRRVSSDPPSVRQNEKGEPLLLRILTSGAPASYKKVAEEIQKQWAQLGVKVYIDIPATREEFEGKLLKRDYDILLFGQSLLDNLDSYPYWHSTGVQRITGNEKDLQRDAYNLSQYKSFKADSLLETIRKTGDEKERIRSLKELQDILKEDVPAIFLYSPVYTYAHRQKILGIELGNLSLHSDRFLTLHKWYVREGRVFKTGQSWLSFFSWLPSLVGL
jgi:ABC-type transport system substrate-binding protein